MATAEYDVVVSGLVLNFVPLPERMLAEMARALTPGGMLALYVWDYAGKMQLLRHFWDAAAALDPEAVELDEGRRFPICHPERLAELFRGAGLEKVETRPIDVPTHFRDFDDYWQPFLGGQGPAPGYAQALSEARRAALRERLRAALPAAIDGSIPLVARAWAVCGTRSDLQKRHDKILGLFPITTYQLLFMSNRSLWNWTIIIGAALAVLGVVVARLLEVLLPANAINVVVAVFFTLCVVAMMGLIAVFTLRRR